MRPKFYLCEATGMSKAKAYDDEQLVWTPAVSLDWPEREFLSMLIGSIPRFHRTTHQSRTTTKAKISSTRMRNKGPSVSSLSQKAIVSWRAMLSLKWLSSKNAYSPSKSGQTPPKMMMTMSHVPRKELKYPSLMSAMCAKSLHHLVLLLTRWVSR